MSEPLKVFIIYSHNDRQQNTELKTRLAVMESEGKIKLGADNEILPGDEWYKDISTNLAASDILLYLVSPTSLASKNCNKELAEALNSKIRVIPIILEHCGWQHHQLSDFQALPDKGEPINTWQPESNGWQNVVDGIRKVVDKIQSPVDSPSETSEKELRAELALQQGNVCMMLGQMEMVIEAYSHVIELNLNNPQAYNNRGVAYSGRDDFDRTIEDYTKAIELNPDYAIAYNNRGMAYGAKSEVDCLPTQPSSPSSNLAVIRAIKDYNPAIELNPDLAPTYYNRGVAWLRLREWERAKSDLNVARDKGINIITVFRNDYESVEGFEGRNGVQLPEDIAAMLL